jgi:PII-like signaling protein
MNIPESAVLLRVFLADNEMMDGRPAYEKLVLKAKEMNMAGATVLRGIMGYGAGAIHTAKLVDMSAGLPVVVEIVDAEEKINKFLPEVDRIMKSGLVTIEKAKVLHYRHTK